MTDTSYDLCPTCGREEVADICPAMCRVEQEIENLVDDILAQCREKVAHAEEISERKELTDRAREERRHQVADLSWTLATLRHIKRQIGA
jgi:hypothetical protein